MIRNYAMKAVENPQRLFFCLHWTLAYKQTHSGAYRETQKGAGETEGGETEGGGANIEKNQLFIVKSL